MAYSLQEVPSDGTLSLLSVGLEYFDRSEIKVYFDGVEDALPWAWVGTSDKLISFDPAVPDGVVVLLKRVSSLEDIRHSLTGGAQFTDEVMDENFIQVLRIAQEAVEQTGQGAIDIAQNALDVANSVIGVADAAAEFATEALETVEDAENIALAAAATANAIAGTANAAFAAASNAEDVALAAEAAVAGKVDTTDPRLSDTRDPNPHSHTISDVTGLQTELDGKQATLVSGTNIKTINGQSVLGSGNIVTPTGLAAASTAEAQAGTSNTVAITPLRLKEAQIRLGTAANSTSGTVVGFFNIPSWAKRITVMFDGVSTNGMSLIQIQLGATGGFETSGYLGGATYFSANSANSSGFLIDYSGGPNATVARSGVVTISLLGSNTWCSLGVVNYNHNSVAVSGSKTLSGTLDRIRITTVNGTDTFDAGKINISWE